MRFQEVFNLILSEWEKNPEIPIEKVIENFSSKFNLAEDDCEDLELSNQLIDEFRSMREEMQEARDKGISRQTFVDEKFESLIEDAPEENKKEIIKSLVEASEDLCDNSEISEIE